ncbi:cytochrome c biogenesis protein DipZ [Bordetella genomosp. 13]|uniref:cytochrome c biogenesis protein DipZ n=1 Tax=Bordetella genomosp. 13 TaxID=463040 RepID=UPI0011AAF3E5|nr:cytochrome c biogenesis protein DipZ [Bordetella genomosp. 13]
MLLLVLAYLGGVLTILSPCILPVLPFVFSSAGQSFTRGALPLLAGMVLTFALVASLAAVGGGWVVAANQYGRWLALALVALFAVALLWPRLAERLAHPLVSAGNRLTERAQAGGPQPGAAQSGGPKPGASFLLGIATGLLWAPCAGPILGLVLTGAALQGASLGTSLLLLAYAAGAATSLAVALLVGGKVYAAMKRSLGAGEWLRRGMGVAMLAGVGAIALGLDTGVLAQVSTASTGGLEQRLVDTLGGSRGGPAGAKVGSAQGGSMAMQGSNSMGMQDVNGAAMESSNPAAMQARPAMRQQGAPAMAMQATGPAMMAAGGAMRAAGTGFTSSLPIEGTLPPLDGAVQWLNSPPLTAEALRGKVVLIDFWTYSCINCLRALPYVKAWADKYRDQGLVVIGVHAPEFAFERDVGNVAKAVKRYQLDYPVAVDNNYAIWRAFDNQYWPAHYFIDAQGRVRHHHFGEGDYEQSERVIQDLLREAGAQVAGDASMVSAQAQADQMAADMNQVQSPETYLGYDRAENFASGEAVRDQAGRYTAPAQPGLNAWGLDGRWIIGAEQARLEGPSGRIVYRFHARDLHLVLGPGPDGKPVRFRVTVDGQAPRDAHGADVAADGTGTVTEQRLYQLVRQPGAIADRTFSIEFLDPDVSAYAFTFG